MVQDLIVPFKVEARKKTAPTDPSNWNIITTTHSCGFAPHSNTQCYHCLPHQAVCWGVSCIYPRHFASRGCLTGCLNLWMNIAVPLSTPFGRQLLLLLTDAQGAENDWHPLPLKLPSCRQTVFRDPLQWLNWNYFLADNSLNLWMKYWHYKECHILHMPWLENKKR